MLYAKPFETIEGLTEKLKTRGLAIPNETQAKKELNKIGYYRLSGYYYIFRKLSPNSESGTANRLDEFEPGITFENILDLYYFDKHLRILLLDALETIEVAIRATIAHELSFFDPLSYLDTKYINPIYLKPDSKTKTIKYEEWKKDFETKKLRSKDTFLDHFKKKYSKSAQLPLWIAVELWDFGSTSKFFELLRTQYQQAITKQFSIPNQTLLLSWLRHLNFLRNCCAHHSRIWNQHFAFQPQIPSHGQIELFDSSIRHLKTVPNQLYLSACIIKYFLFKISPNSDWHSQWADRIQNFPKIPIAAISDMGFPSGWEDQNIWTV